jgi:PiT family inorganic phosphate transporter
MGWPVSTTHSIVGAIVGFAAVGISSDAVNWGKVANIVASWVVSPVLAGVMSFGLFKSVQVLILNTDKPFENAKRYIPMYMFLVGFMIIMVTLLKGLKHIFKDSGFVLSFGESAAIAAVGGIIVASIGSLLLRRIKRDESLETSNRFVNVERVFAVLMILRPAPWLLPMVLTMLPMRLARSPPLWVSFKMALLWLKQQCPAGYCY